MKKINKERSLRIALATLAIPSIIGISSHTFNKKEKNLSKESKQTLIECNSKIKYLDKYLNIYKKANDNDLSKEYRKIDGLTYKNYSYQEPNNIVEYINKRVNTYNIEESFEKLYSLILSEATGIDFTEPKLIKNYSYLKSDREMLKQSNGNELKTLKDFYFIREEDASLLLKIIKTCPNRNNMYTKMKKDPNFDTNDYIVGLYNYYNNSINNYYNIEYEFINNHYPEYYNNNSKKNIKKYNIK